MRALSSLLFKKNRISHWLVLFSFFVKGGRQKNQRQDEIKSYHIELAKDGGKKEKKKTDSFSRVPPKGVAQQKGAPFFCDCVNSSPLKILSPLLRGLTNLPLPVFAKRIHRGSPAF
jgi:hypothetical protein